MKICFKCGQVKSAQDFYVHPQMADGRLGKCKECTKTDARNHRVANRDAMLAYERKRLDDPKRRLSQRLQSRAWRLANKQKRKDALRRSAEKYPEKQYARNTLSNAVRDGKVKRMPCEICGNEKSQGHHEDYSKPLEVKWLCSRCHGLQHRKAA